MVCFAFAEVSNSSSATALSSVLMTSHDIFLFDFINLSAGAVSMGAYYLAQQLSFQFCRQNCKRLHTSLARYDYSKFLFPRINCSVPVFYFGSNIFSLV